MFHAPDPAIRPFIANIEVWEGVGILLYFIPYIYIYKLLINHTEACMFLILNGLPQLAGIHFEKRHCHLLFSISASAGLPQTHV